jgi:hypothetical protein
MDGQQSTLEVGLFFFKWCLVAVVVVEESAGASGYGFFEEA